MQTIVINVFNTFVRRNPKDRKRTMAFNIACICCTRTVSKPNYINYDSSYQFTNTELRSTLFLKCTYIKAVVRTIIEDYRSMRVRISFGGRGGGGEKGKIVRRNHPMADKYWPRRDPRNKTVGARVKIATGRKSYSEFYLKRNVARTIGNGDSIRFRKEKRRKKRFRVNLEERGTR